MSQCSKAERDKVEAKDRKTKNENRNKKESNSSLKTFSLSFFLESINLIYKSEEKKVYMKASGSLHFEDFFSFGRHSE
jgi:hypothetical protein